MLKICKENPDRRRRSADNATFSKIGFKDFGFNLEFGLNFNFFYFFQFWY